ncbi:hypothetical protein KSX_26110 [Ktedonospora formicarum]|uniref:Uncharacterized protein n=1 Tax=Ktedonospora formicarum TaxID=2778364 RepID=A0A8J3I1P6_9CHLR|nr:hypothetical protein KSX_26110 [Ktedonospora formicarum]
MTTDPSQAAINNLDTKRRAAINGLLRLLSEGAISPTEYKKRVDAANNKFDQGLDELGVPKAES